MQSRLHLVAPDEPTVGLVAPIRQTRVEQGEPKSIECRIEHHRILNSDYGRHSSADHVSRTRARAGGP